MALAVHVIDGRDKYMKLTRTVIGLLALIAFSLGCAGAGAFTQPAGVMPTGTFFAETTSGAILHDNGATASKSGKACGTSILGLVGTGDTSVSTAMANGGVRKAVYTEVTYRNILGLFAEVCTVVKGN